MKKNKLPLLIKFSVVAVLLAVLGSVSSLKVDASSSNDTSAFFDKGVSIFDSFNDLHLFPDERQYWWLENGGDDGQGIFAFVRDQYCGLQSCVRPLHENQDKYVRLELKPNDNEGIFTIANLSEEIDNHDSITDPAYNGFLETGAWNPTVDNPIVMEQKMRFSSNYNNDGSGGAVGSGGVWLWNNPFSQEASNPFAIYDGFGFSWAQEGSLGAPGLHAVLLRSTYPVFVQLIRDVNPQEWNTYKTVWSVDQVGVQTIVYFINDQLVASTPVIGSDMQDMSVEVWIDNQFFQLGDDGFPMTSNPPVPEGQHIDIDYISIIYGSAGQPVAAQLDIESDL